MKAIVRGLKPSSSSGERRCLSPHPSPNRQPAKLASSTVGSRRLYVPPAFVGLDHRVLGRPLAGRARWPSPSSLVVSCRLSVGGYSKLYPVPVRHRRFSALARWAARRASSSSLSVGVTLSLPHPPSIVSRLKPASSTDCSRRLHVPSRHSSSVLLSRPVGPARRASSSAGVVSCRLSLVGRKAKAFLK